MKLFILIIICNFLLGLLAYWVSFLKVCISVKAKMINSAKDGDKIYVKDIVWKARQENFQNWFGGSTSDEIMCAYFTFGSIFLGWVFFLFNFISLIWTFLFSNWFNNSHTVVKKHKDFDTFLKEAENYDPQELFKRVRELVDK